MQRAPHLIHEAAQDILDGLDAFRQEEFAQRIDRWYPDVRLALDRLYGDEGEAGPLARDLVARAAAAYRDRPAELCRHDRERLLTPDWLQSPRMVGYACYTERFAGDLQGVESHLDYLQELGVTYLHLMPLLRPRDGDNDGGYAVADYRAVRPDLGTTEDLRHLADALRARGMSLVMDLVLNHVAREHEWAVAARRGEEGY